MSYWLMWGVTASCVVAVAFCGLAQFGRAVPWEVSSRTASGAAMIAGAGTITEVVLSAGVALPVTILAMVLCSASLWVACHQRALPERSESTQERAVRG